MRLYNFCFEGTGPFEGFAHTHLHLARDSSKPYGLNPLSSLSPLRSQSMPSLPPAILLLLYPQPTSFSLYLVKAGIKRLKLVGFDAGGIAQVGICVALCHFVFAVEHGSVGWHSYFCYINGKLEIIIYKIHVLLIF